MILLSHSKDNIYLLTFSTISQFQYYHSIPANLLPNQTNSMPISYSKDICLSLNIFSISRVYPSLLVPKSDKFNTKPLPSYSKGDRFYFYLIDIYNIFCSCALCMLACVFLYLRVQCRYLVCQILWLHYLEKYLQSILLMCMYVCVFPSPCGYLVCRILWQVEIR